MQARRMNLRATSNISNISRNSSQNGRDGTHLTRSYDGGHITSLISPRQIPPTQDRSNPSNAACTWHQPILALTNQTFSDHHDTDITNHTLISCPQIQSKLLSLEKELPTLPPPTPNTRSPAATLKRPTTAPYDQESPPPSQLLQTKLRAARDPPPQPA